MRGKICAEVLNTISGVSVEADSQAVLALLLVYARYELRRCAPSGVSLEVVAEPLQQLPRFRSDGVATRSLRLRGKGVL